MTGVHSNDDRYKRKSGFATQVMLSIVALPFGFGCAALETDLVSDGTIHLEQVSSNTARLSRVRVYENDGDLIVYGKIGRQSGVKGRVDATVRVIIRYPDGRILEETKRAFPPYLPIRRSRKSNFTLRFSDLPPVGAVIRIECPQVPANAPASSSPVVSFQNKEMPQ